MKIDINLFKFKEFIMELHSLTRYFAYLDFKKLDELNNPDIIVQQRKGLYKINDKNICNPFCYYDSCKDYFEFMRI